MINNYINAIRVSLLLLPAAFTEIDLYKTITSLSYMGDIRMIIGENKNKIENIVGGNIGGFQQIYRPLILKNFSNFINYDSATNIYTKSTDTASRFELLQKVPTALLKNILKLAPDINELATRNENCDLIVRKSLSNIVRASSISQTAKGILTAGFIKSILYGFEKITN